MGEEEWGQRWLLCSVARGRRRVPARSVSRGEAALLPLSPSLPLVSLVLGSRSQSPWNARFLSVEAGAAGEARKDGFMCLRISLTAYCRVISVGIHFANISVLKTKLTFGT